MEIATGSVFEVVSQATIGRNQGFLNPIDYERLSGAAKKQSGILSGLRKSLETPGPSTLNLQPSTTPNAWFWVEAATCWRTARSERKPRTSWAPRSAVGRLRTKLWNLATQKR